MDLETMQARWAEQEKRLEVCLRLNTHLMVRAPLRWFSWGVGIGVALQVGLMAAVGGFVFAYGDEARYLIPALALLAWLGAMTVTGVRQVRLAMGIRYDQPVAALQKQMGALWRLRLWTSRWALLTGQLVWWVPCVIVGTKGLLGLDPYRIFGWPFLLLNLAFGVVVIPVAIRVAACFDRSWLARQLAGQQLNKANDFLATIAAFEKG
jgi:hypothetical protein